MNSQALEDQRELGLRGTDKKGVAPLSDGWKDQGLVNWKVPPNSVRLVSAYKRLTPKKALEPSEEAIDLAGLLSMRRGV